MSDPRKRDGDLCAVECRLVTVCGTCDEEIAPFQRGDLAEEAMSSLMFVSVAPSL